ncbi:hypothetical protein [Legionella waltersii]|uniref:Interaptin n=1 Tax=Legionella waltersii TaxID=66969 RepID=A0A0W1A4I3_9GAMM|nr:hypothetical protein [Legionella waltersii]KTD76268.1 interaptin [Legionella waltersii]SNV13317.1 interaptin [Legionella waltersii]
MMKEIILQLIKEISALSSPVSAAALKQVFKSTPLPSEEVPQELIPYYAALRKLSIYADQYEESSALINENELKKSSYNELLKQTREVQLEFERLNQELESSKIAINLFYKTIESNARQYLPSLSSSPTIKEFGETQKNVVREYDAYLTKAFKDRVLHYAKLEFIYKTRLIDKLITQLNEKDFSIVNTQDASSINNLLSELTLTNKKLIDLKTRWNGDKNQGLLYRFDKVVSSKEKQEKEKEIMAEIELIETELKSIPTLLDNNKLSHEDKLSLTETFNTTPDTKGLISGYENQIDGLLSYVNPFSWMSWSQNGNYAKDQERLRNSVEYLKLLEKQRGLKLEHNEKEAHRSRVLKLFPEQNPIPSDKDNSVLTNSKERNDVLLDAVDLINDLPAFKPSISLTPESPLLDFSLLLFEQMPLVLAQEEKNSSIIALLQELIPLKRTVEELVAHHKLTLPVDLQYATPEEAEKAKENFGQADSEQLAWIEQHKQCEIYFSKAKSLEEVVLRVREASNKARDLTKQLRENSYKPESEASVLQTPGHLITLSQRIETTLRELRQLPPIKTDAPVQTTTEDVQHLPQHQPVTEQSKKNQTGSVQQNTVDNPLRSLESNPLQSAPADESKIELVPSQRQHEVITPVLSSGTEVRIASEPVAQPLQEKPIIKEPERNETTDSRPIQPAPNHKLTLFPIAASLVRTTTDKPTVLIEPPLEPAKLQDKPVNSSPPKPLLITVASDQNQSEDSASNRSIGLSESNTTSLSDEVDVYNDQEEQQSDDFYVSQSDQLSLPKTPSGNQFPPIGSKNTTSDVTLAPVKIQTQDIVLTPDVEDPNSHLLAYYHNLNLSLISHHATNVQEWYRKLYGAITKSSLDAHQNLKAIHLLKDILFEFQFKQDMSTINAYMRLCPTPESDFSALLSLKPAIPIIESEADEESIFENCPKELQKFYDQFVRLKGSFPVEAKLFIQAMHSFVLMKESIDQSQEKINPSNIPKLTQDPRFDPLKRHRGFMQIWEFFEDIYNWIVGKITQKAEHEYTNRPCFFRTQSAKLLDEVDAMTQNMLLGNSPETVASLQ